MIYRGNDVETIVLLYLLKDCMKGKMPSSDSPRAGSRDAPLVWRNAEHVWRFSNCLSLECSATVICSEFITLQRYLVRDSRHLLVRQWRKKEKKKTDVEDLRPPVVGMCPSRKRRDIEYITMTDGPRTSTFAFSEIRTLPHRSIRYNTDYHGESDILDNFQIPQNLTHKLEFYSFESKAIK